MRILTKHTHRKYEMIDYYRVISYSFVTVICIVVKRKQNTYSMTTPIAITTGIIGTTIGMVGLLPGLMAFDAGDKTTTSMTLTGISTLSIVPLSIISTTMTIRRQDLKYQYLYGLPIVGICIGFIMERQNVPERSSPVVPPISHIVS